MKNKTLAAWLAFLGGPVGLHRFYLHGFKDALGWLHPLPTLMGLYGIQRVQAFGQDDRLSWLLIPLLGLMVAQAMPLAILYGSNEKQQGIVTIKDMAVGREKAKSVGDRSEWLAARSGQVTAPRAALVETVKRLLDELDRGTPEPENR